MTGKNVEQNSMTLNRFFQNAPSPGMWHRRFRILFFVPVMLSVLLLSRCATLESIPSYEEVPEYFGYDSYWGLFCGCTVNRLETDDASASLNRVFARIKEDFKDNDEILQDLENSFRAQGFELRKEVDAGGKTRQLVAVIEGDLSFPTGSSKLTPKALEIVDKVGDGLAEIPNTVARVHGHTDTPGSYQGNKILSLNRAKSVRDALVNRKGISPSRILEVAGFADDRKIVDTNAAEPRNRRTEILVDFQGQ
jgi:outer membrane protein OmpA-like peptidoglycan-associated protein